MYCVRAIDGLLNQLENTQPSFLTFEYSGEKGIQKEARLYMVFPVNLVIILSDMHCSISIYTV